MSGSKEKKGGKLKWIIIVIVLFAVIGSAGEEKDETPKLVETKVAKENEKADTINQEVKKDVFYLHETAELNGVQVTMTGYEVSKGSEFNTPADGNEFVLVEFEICNNTEEEMVVSSIMSFEAYADDYALEYSLGALMEKEESAQLDGSVAAGKKMKGIIGYEVPMGWKNMEIHFTDDVWNDNVFKFMLKNE